MGGSTSVEQKQEIVNDIMTEMVTNILVRNATTSSFIVQNKQEIEFNQYAPFDCDQTLIKQSINADTKFVMNVSNDVAVDVVNEIQNQMNSKTSQIYKEVEDAIANLTKIGKDEKLSVTQSIMNRIRTLVRNNIKVENITDIKTVVINEQKIVINIYAPMSGELCKFDQDIFVRVTASAIVKNAVDAIVHDSVINDIIADADQEVSKTSNTVQILMMIAVIMVIAIIGKLVMSSGGGGGGSFSGKIVKFLVIAAILIGVYLFIGWKTKCCYPFRSKK